MSIQEPIKNNYLNDNLIDLSAVKSAKRQSISQYSLEKRKRYEKLELELLPPACREEITQENVKNFYKRLVNILLD